MMTATIAAAIAFVAGFWVGVWVGWTKRKTLDGWDLAQADRLLSQVIDERQAAINDAATWHRKAIQGPPWIERARLAHRLEQLEHICAVNGVETTP